jgi:hypothetical protein
VNYLVVLSDMFNTIEIFINGVLYLEIQEWVSLVLMCTYSDVHFVINLNITSRRTNVFTECSIVEHQSWHKHTYVTEPGRRSRNGTLSINHLSIFGREKKFIFSPKLSPRTLGSPSFLFDGHQGLFTRGRTAVA